jgi:hypothetical protein
MTENRAKQFSDYIVYVDESGDHGLESIDPTYPMFVLVFCVFRKQDYVDIVTPALAQLKMRFWGHDEVVLHEHDIRKPQNEFVILIDRATRQTFTGELTGLINNAPFIMVASVVDKKKLSCQYVRPESPYDISLGFGLERVFRHLEEAGQSDKITPVIVERKGKLLAMEVSARITSADQKCFEIPATEDEGLDMELEFTNDEGKGTGSRLYLQLKAGNSYLRIRKNDGVEIFTIKKQSWVKYWLKQPHPVMLVIGTFPEKDECSMGKDKLEFAEVRWMEITSYLKRQSQDGTKPVKHIEFTGERMDMASVRKWRDKALAQSLP